MNVTSPSQIYHGVYLGTRGPEERQLAFSTEPEVLALHNFLGAKGLGAKHEIYKFYGKLGNGEYRYKPDYSSQYSSIARLTKLLQDSGGVMVQGQPFSIFA